MKKRSSSGFTLIELLVVIAVSAILAVVLITLLNPSTQFKKARDGRRKNDFNQIKKALYLYANDHNGVYPENLSFGEIFQDEAIEMVYMKKVPLDPVNDNTQEPALVYSYITFNNNRDFCLLANLERENDPDSPGSIEICETPCCEFDVCNPPLYVICND